MLFAAVHRSGSGTKCECRFVPVMAAFEGTADDNAARMCAMCRRSPRQISKARAIAIGSDLLAMHRYLAVDSIFS